MILEKGVIYSCSNKQKLDTKKSMEAQIVNVDGLMPQILWTYYFSEAQGFNITDNILYQDNQSTIRM